MPTSSESPQPDLILNLGVQRDERGRVALVILDFGEPVQRLTLQVDDARRLIADLQALLTSAEQ